MSQLSEELFEYADDVIKAYGTSSLKNPDCRVAEPDAEEVAEFLCGSENEEAIDALHEFLDDEQERLDQGVRHNFVRAILRAATGYPDLAPLLADPILQEFVE